MMIRSIAFILISGFIILRPGGDAMSFEYDATLTALISEAYEANNEIKAMEVSVEGLQSKSVYEGALADPQLGFSLANVPVDSLNFRDEAMTQKQVFVAQTFPWPGKRELKSRVAGLDAKILEQKLKARKLAMARTVAGYYYDLGIVARKRDINSETSQLIEKLLQVAHTRYASGKGNRQDMLLARIELDKLNSERLDLQSRYRQMENKINGLLNREHYMAIPRPLVPASPGRVDNIRPLKDRALAENPDLAALLVEISRNDTRKVLSGKEKYPDVTMKFSYGQRDSDPMGRNRTDFVSFGATIPIPLWKHQRQDKDLAFRDASLRSAAYRLRDLKVRIAQEVEQMAIDLNASAERYDIYKTSLVPSAQDLALSMRAGYEVGNTEFSPMITAQINALSMQLAADILLFEQAKKQAEFDELIGNLMDSYQGKDNEKYTSP